MGHGFFLTLLASSALWLSCDSPSPDLPDIRYEGRHIRFGTTAQPPPCERTLHALDNRIEALIDLLEIPLPPGKKIHIYWMKDAMERTPCAPHMDGCATVQDGEMLAFISQLEAAEHESVHLLLWPFGIGHKLLVEGAAECFGGLCRQAPLPASHDAADLLSLVDSPIDTIDDYRLAGTFVCYLSNRFGVEPVRRILFQSRPSWTLSDFNRGFSAVFLLTFEEAIEAFVADRSGREEIGTYRVAPCAQDNGHIPDECRTVPK